ncbi:MAG: hypothetical protein ACLP1X_08260 [Polyangiaceae bacterium]
MTSSSRFALSLVVCVAAMAPGRHAGAQPSAPTAQELETARTLYKQGKELRASGDLRGALEKFQAAHALGNTPVTGIELARTYVLVGRIVEAREVCLYIARMPVASDETEKSAEARAEAIKVADDLKPRIPTLVVRVAGLAPGEAAHVSIDGTLVPDAAMSEAQKVNPGRHTVIARATDGRQVEGVQDVAEGQAAEVTLTLPPVRALPLAPESALTPAPAPLESASSPLVKIGVSVAAVAGAVGVVAGLVAWNKRGELDQVCNAHQCDTAHGGAGDLATAYSWATLSTVSFAVAGAGVATAVAGVLSRGHPAAHEQGGARVIPWIGPGAAGIHGRF